jgi:hypothetical protein
MNLTYPYFADSLPRRSPLGEAGRLSIVFMADYSANFTSQS